MGNQSRPVVAEAQQQIDFVPRVSRARFSSVSHCFDEAYSYHTAQNYSSNVVDPLYMREVLPQILGFASMIPQEMPSGGHPCPRHLVISALDDHTLIYPQLLNHPYSTPVLTT